MFYGLLLKVLPSLYCYTRKGDRSDNVILVCPKYLEKLYMITFTLEVIYKVFRYILISSLLLSKRPFVVDEGIALGWANYLYLMLYRGALKSKHVLLFIRLDLTFLRLLSNISNVFYCLIDRRLDVLERFWYMRGNKTPYDLKYYGLVRYSFRLFSEVYARSGIRARVKYIFLNAK